MYTKEDMIAFAKWWFGPDADGLFPNQPNVTTEQGFEYWEKNVYRSSEIEVAE